MDLHPCHSLSTLFGYRLDHQSTISGSLSLQYYRRRSFIIASQLQTLKLDKSALNVAEAELWAASILRVRSFYDFEPSLGIEDHKKYLAEREFEVLNERVARKRRGFRRVSCINATLPLTQVSSISDDLCTACKRGAEDVMNSLTRSCYWESEKCYFPDTLPCSTLLLNPASEYSYANCLPRGEGSFTLISRWTQISKHQLF